MENRSKKLSLKLGQKKLKLDHKPQQASSSHTSPPPTPETQLEVPSTKSSWISGLCNLGNTCYANCILQILRFCPHFTSQVTTLAQLLEQQATKNNGIVSHGTEAAENVVCGEDWQSSDGALAIHLHKLWQRMTDKERLAANKSSVSSTRPHKFLSKLKEEHCMFDNKLQQDAQELLRFLLTNLHDIFHKTLKTLSASEATPSPSIAVVVSDGSQDVAVMDLPLSKNIVSRKRQLSHAQNRSYKQQKCSTRKTKKLTDYYSRIDSLQDSTVINCVEKKKEKYAASTEATWNGRREHSDFIKKMFQGELVSQTRCYECENFTRRTEPFFDISLPVSSHGLPGFLADYTPVKTKEGTPGCQRDELNRNDQVRPVSLPWALSQFCLREKLDGENKYSCENCKHLVEAEKTVLFGHLPQIMTLHLNRFMAQAGSGLLSNVSVTKIAGNIAVPLALSFSTWCTEDCEERNTMYHLFAVVFHAGSSCSSGHYTACVRGRECLGVVPPPTTSWIKDDNDWVYFDDELVELITQLELRDLLSPLTSLTAYILFYTKSML